MSGIRTIVFSAAACIVALLPAQAEQGSTSRNGLGVDKRTFDVSSQTRREFRRARTRIEVRPLYRSGPVRRECVPVFQERWIPQWGGLVLYASQSCWWTRG